MDRHDLSQIHFPDHHGEEEPLDGAPDADQIRDSIWRTDNVVLTTVGVDVGSSTFHLIFSRIHLQRLQQRLSSRFVVVRREVLWRSPIWLTPYRSDDRIDAEELGVLLAQAYREAGLGQEDVDSGAVILTGEALKRSNARAIADLFAEQAGKFVCASAGHNLEAVLAAHGSGSVALSRADGRVLLNVDVGGGTSKLALVRDGEVLGTAAMEVGGRLVALDGGGRVVRIESPARLVAHELGVPLRLGQPLGEAAGMALVRALAGLLVELVRGDVLSPLAQTLLLTSPLPPDLPRPQAILFSGGVAEYIYGREHRDYGDLARPLAEALRAEATAGRLPAPVAEPGEAIRATVIGASQFTVQLSGNTIAISNPAILPFRNVPVLYPRLDGAKEISADLVAAAIRDRLARFDLEEGSGPIALAFSWDGDPFYASLRALADGIAQALPRSIERRLPLVMAFDRDVGRSVGEILKEELGVPGEVISFDGMELREFDYIDVGEVIQPANVVPVVIKSLLFPEVSPELRGELLEV